MTLAERLNAQIEEKEERIQELEEKLESQERQFDLSMLTWQMHRAFENDEFSKQMPFPRLEMRMSRVSPDDWYAIEWTYGLVYKHYSDTENEMLRFIPFSRTDSSGGTGKFEMWLQGGKLNQPHRDRFHIRADALTLNLPAYIICREKDICEKIDFEGYHIDQMITKMRSK